MSSRLLPLLVAALLFLPACALFGEVDTGPPSYTWTGGTPPSAPSPDTTAAGWDPDHPPLRVPGPVQRDTASTSVVVEDSLASPGPDMPAAESDVPDPVARDASAPAEPPPVSKPEIRFPDWRTPPAPPSDTLSAPDDEPETDAAPEPEPASPSQPEPATEEPSVEEPPAETPSFRAIGRLDLINRENRDDLSLPDFLTGRNKVGGPALRFRRHVPPDTPSYVARSRDGLPLFLADDADAGWLAFYKGDCGGLGDVCAYRAVLYGSTGTPRWALDLNDYLTRDRFVEIQDVRLHDGALYFNEACATYADEADGQCSYLVRVDPEFREVAWRTPPLTSNNIFIFADPYVVAGYGFTAEADSLYLVEQRTGRIAARTGLDSAHEYLELQDGTLYVVTYRSVYAFDLVGKD